MIGGAVYHPSMRLFIAILFPEDTVDRIASIRDSIHDLSSSGSFSPRENLHLTLEFLGECSAAERDMAAEAMEASVCRPFTMTMDRTGSFPRPDGDIWWLGCREEKALMTLQGKLHRELSKRGLKLEKRRYRPHVTLGRRVFSSAVAGGIEPIVSAVSSFSLILSERGERGMVYTPLHTVVLPS